MNRRSDRSSASGDFQSLNLAFERSVVLPRLRARPSPLRGDRNLAEEQQAPPRLLLHAPPRRGRARAPRAENPPPELPPRACASSPSPSPRASERATDLTVARPGFRLNRKAQTRLRPAAVPARRSRCPPRPPGPDHAHRARSRAHAVSVGTRHRRLDAPLDDEKRRRGPTRRRKVPRPPPRKTSFGPSPRARGGGERVGRDGARTVNRPGVRLEGFRVRRGERGERVSHTT